jgi:ubiquinone/menaquinone biosynthesis C-methylase UbiE
VDGDLQRRITGFWSTVASGYEAHGGNVPARDSEEHDAWSRALDQLLPPPPADVLDIGTGTGFVAMLAATSGHRVTATDLAGPMLAEATAEAARRGLPVAFTQDDAVSPSLPAASFDAVVSRHLIWTLRDPLAALTAWRRLLRPGGRVVAIDGFWFAPLSADDAPNEGLFEAFYDRSARASLPGWRYFDTDPIVALFNEAGFSRLTVTWLEEVRRVAEHPGSDRPPYAVVGFAD